MAVITFSGDVAPHLRRGLMYRRLRRKRAQFLYESRPDPYDDYHPYSGLETASSVDLLIGLICSLGSSLLPSLGLATGRNLAH